MADEGVIEVPDGWERNSGFIDRDDSGIVDSVFGPDDFVVDIRREPTGEHIVFLRVSSPEDGTWDLESETVVDEDELQTEFDKMIDEAESYE